ncbi:MAG: hypothetical protein JST58_01525 [Bacteroidetes bacterium]|nr:hypothetical protein [Bacteroidota bacterium]
MKTAIHTNSTKLMRSGILFISLLAIVMFAFASTGGGDKKKNIPTNDNFTPINLSSAFSLKNGVSYMGSHIFGQQRDKNSISVNTLITYQNGNTIYLMPYKYKISISAQNNPSPTSSNLQLLNLKIKVH